MSGYMQISSKNIVILDEIGRGGFGKVYKGKVKSTGQTVAVKVYENTTDLDGVYQECRQMAALCHPNVVSTLGIVYTNPPKLVMEYMIYGDLFHYLNNNHSINAVNMIQCAYAIAKGMRYLHHELRPYKKHQDLAARNCLIGKNWTIKIADLGCWGDGYTDTTEYTSEIYQSDREGNECNRPAPYRWMAPECVPYNGKLPWFSRKNDIWAFGVVLFEIWTKGEVPYEGLQSYDAIAVIAHGSNPRQQRLRNRGVQARTHILSLMTECWNKDSTERPNFKAIVRHFEEYEPRICA